MPFYENGERLHLHGLNKKESNEETAKDTRNRDREDLNQGDDLCLECGDLTCARLTFNKSEANDYFILSWRRKGAFIAPC